VAGYCLDKGSVAVLPTCSDKQLFHTFVHCTKLQRMSIKGQCRKIFPSVFFFQRTPLPHLLIHSLKPFQIWHRIRRNIRV
jgi:hypothetical protein